MKIITSDIVKVCIDLNSNNAMYVSAKEKIIANKTKITSIVDTNIYNELCTNITLNQTLSIYYLQHCLEKYWDKPITILFYSNTNLQTLPDAIVSTLKVIDKNHDITLMVDGSIITKTNYKEYGFFITEESKIPTAQQSENIDIISKTARTYCNTPNGSPAYDTLDNNFNILSEMVGYTEEVQDLNLMKCANPVATFKALAPRTGETFSYCIQGAQATTKLDYEKFVAGVLNMVGVTQSNMVFKSVKDVLSTNPHLKQEYIQLRAVVNIDSVDSFCSIVGNYEFKDAIKNFIKCYPDVLAVDLLKYFLVAVNVPKIFAYDIQDDIDTKRCLHLAVLMGNTILVVNPSHKITWNIFEYINEDNTYQNVASLEQLIEMSKKNLSPTMANTMTQNTMNQISARNASMLDDLGQKIAVKFMFGTFEDIKAYWDLNFPLREGFENTGVFVSLPVIFTCINGIMKDRSFKKDLKKLMLSTEIATDGITTEHMNNYLIDKSAMRKYLIDRDFPTLRHIFSRFLDISDESLKVIKSSIDAILDTNILGTTNIKGDYQLDTAEYLMKTVFTLTREEIELILQTNSFTGKPAQYVLYRESKLPIPRYEVYKLVLLAFTGCFDILILNPYKYNTIESHINTNFLNVINLPDLDMNFSFNYKVKRNLLNTLFD